MNTYLCCCDFKIGKLKIYKEDGKIASVYPAESSDEILPPKTDLLKKTVLQLEEYFNQ